MRKKSFLILSLCVVIQLCTISLRAQDPSILLSADEFNGQFKDYPESILLDIRTPEEYAKGHLLKAINVDWLSGEFEARISTLDTASRVFIYCLGGGRSASAALKMKEMGFKEIYELEGGILMWRAANLPEEIGGKDMGITKAGFDELVHTGDLAVVVFYGDWCNQCNRLKPVINEIRTDMSEKVKVYWIHVDDNRELVKEFHIDAIPVIHVYKDHSLYWSHTGFIDKLELVGHLQ